MGIAIALAAGLHCDGTTGDRRVRFGGTITGSGTVGVTERGWRLQFERFIAAVGPVRVHADAAFASRTSPSHRGERARWAWRNVLRRLSLGVAFAQHCHGCPGAPLAEFNFERGGAVFKAVDLLSSQPFSLGAANARNGLYRSVSFTFESPVAIADGGVVGAMLEGHSMTVAGTAERDGERVRFAGSIDLHTLTVANATGPASERPYTAFGVMFDRPEGVRIDDANESTDRVAIRVDLARMFDQADFSRLPAGATPDAVRAIEPDSQVSTAWRLGVENPRTYRVGWVGVGGSGEPRGDAGM